MGVKVSLLYVFYTNLDIPSKKGKSGAASIHGADFQEQQDPFRAHQSLRQHPCQNNPLLKCEVSQNNLVDYS